MGFFSNLIDSDIFKSVSNATGPISKVLKSASAPASSTTTTSGGGIRGKISKMIEDSKKTAVPTRSGSGGIFSKVVNSPEVQKAVGGGGKDAVATTTTTSPRATGFTRLTAADVKSMGLKKGGKVSSKSASARADGCAQRGKTKGRII